MNVQDRIRTGRRNLFALYGYTAASRLWFDGGLWVIYFQHKGISLVEIGILEALLHVISVVSDVPVGIFADRFGWKISLAISSLLGIFYTVITLQANNIWWIALAFAARGFQGTFLSGSSASIAYESAVWAQVQERYLSISGRLFAISLVSMGIAEVVGGALANYSWSAVYVAFTLANLLSFFAVLGIHEPREELHDQEKPHQSALTIALDAIQFAKSSRPFIKWIVLSGTLFGFVSTFAFYGQSLLLQAGWTLIGIGILTGSENGLGAIVSGLAARVVRRFGEKQTVGSSGVLAAVGLVLFAWLPGWSAGIGYLLNSIASNLADPIIDQGLNRLVPSEQRATLLSANSTAFSAFMILVFPLFGVLATAIGLKPAAYIGSGIGACCILASTLWWYKESEARMEAADI